MKILAFMQNPWFRSGTPEKWIIKYRDDQRFHRKILGKSMSGRRLKEAFGDLYDQIHWDNVNWRPSTNEPVRPDFDHISKVIAEVKPDLIICFGKLALQAMEELGLVIPVWPCHHPNARYRTQSDLNCFANMVKEYVAQCNIRSAGNR